MKTDSDLDKQLRAILRRELDREAGPNPTWPESPAAQRVKAVDRRRRFRWPMRVLGVAALLATMGGAALLGGRQEPSVPAANGWVAFTVRQAGVDPSSPQDYDTDIWFAALDQEARRVVGSDPDHLRQECPAFSPDGRSLAYGRVEGHGDQYGVDGLIQVAAYSGAAVMVTDVTADGHVSDRQTIEVGDGVPAPCPVWSPDGKRIAFAANLTSPTNPLRSGQGSQIWIVALADGSITALPDLLATDLEWSPDGSLLAIAGGVEAAYGTGIQDERIHLYDLSSGHLGALDATLGADRLTWSPDGTRIAYTTRLPSDGLRLLNVETGEQQVLVPYFVGAVHGIGLVWAPDGRSIVYQRGTFSGERSDVVVLTLGDPSGGPGQREVVIPLILFGGDSDGSDLTLSPYRVTWSPDGAYLLTITWGNPADADYELKLLMAVPIDPDLAPSVLLRSDSGQPNVIVVQDGYDTTFVHTQVWGRAPSD